MATRKKTTVPGNDRRVAEKLKRKSFTRAASRAKKLTELAKVQAATEKGTRTLNPEDIKVLPVQAALTNFGLAGVGGLRVGNNDLDPTDSYVDLDSTDSWFDMDPTDAIHDLNDNSDAFKFTLA